MIDCVNEKIWYVKRKKQKRKRRKLKRFLIFALIICLITSLVGYFSMKVTEVLAYECEEIVAEYSVVAVNDAVLTTILNDEYSNLMTIEKNTDGSVSFISVNSTRSNLINRNVSAVTKRNLNEVLKDGIPIRAGMFTGIPIFNGMGKTINIDVASVENVICDFTSEFTQEGINQTLHRLYLTVNVDIEIMIPNYRRSKTTSSQILLGESLIVGKIPEVYLNSSQIN